MKSAICKLIRKLDVAILYEIVTTAEQHPDVEKLRFRAIFAAYNVVLERNGLDPNHDQTYFRFLLKLGDQKRAGQSLYKSFESLLQELGIQLEVNEDQGSIQDITREVEEDAVSRRSGDDLKTDVLTSKALSRRNSFDSPGVGRGRTGSRDRMFLPPRPSTRAAFRSMDRNPHEWNGRNSIGYSAVIRQDSPIRDIDTEDRESARRATSRVQNRVETRRSPRQKPSQGADITITPERRPDYSSKNAHHRLSHALQFPNVEQAKTYVIQDNELLYRPSETQCLRDADTFQNFRIRALIRDTLRHWRGLTGADNERHRAQEYMAQFHDRNVLLRQALLLWQDQFHLSRRAAENRMFYYELESRASKARDLYLLAKAFTHWAEITDGEIVKTEAARQHIMQLKYFNAWREITAMNELKVKRHRLKKAFGHWRTLLARHKGAYGAAIAHCDEKVARWVHWKWFWTFCESRIPLWRDARTRRTYFAMWFKAKSTVQEREWQTEERVFRTEISSVLTPWSERAKFYISQEYTAEKSNEQNVKCAFLKCWKRRRRHVLPERQISNMVDWRVAGTTFALFVARFRSERQAESVCNLRITRNAWRVWNDALRSGILSKQINDRLLIEVLYKWVIAERSSLLGRLQQERLQKSALVRLYERCADLRDRRGETCQQLIARWNLRTIGNVFHIWQSRLAVQRRNTEMAHTFLAPRHAEECLRSWILTLGHMQKLATWATRFDFFVTGKRFLKVWSNAVEVSRKQKRQQAYGQVRRKAKVRLAAKMLARSRGKAHYLRLLDEKRVAFNQKRILHVAAGVFDHWTAQSDSVLSLASQAEDRYLGQAVLQHLRSWAAHLDENREMQNKATRFYYLRMAHIASSWLHTLRLKVIEIRAQEAKAAALMRYYERRRVGGWFRQWLKRTTEKLRRPLPQAPLSSRARGSALRNALPHADFNVTEIGSGDVEQPFNERSWMAPDEIEFAATSGLGYLSTPSKRAARAKALIAGSTTPAGTPFPSRLRQQLTSAAPTPESLAFPRTPLSRVRGSRLRTQLDKRLQTPE